MKHITYLPHGYIFFQQDIVLNSKDTPHNHVFSFCGGTGLIGRYCTKQRNNVEYIDHQEYDRICQQGQSNSQRFITKAATLLPEHLELQTLNTNIDNYEHILRVMFRHGGLIGGMATTIIALLKAEDASDPLKG